MNDYSRPAGPSAVTVDVVRLPHFEGLELPSYATAGAAGVDFWQP